MTGSIVTSTLTARRSKERIPHPQDFLPGRSFPLIGSASAGSVFDSDNLETLSCMGGVSSRPGPEMLAPSYLSAVKGDAGRRRRMLGSEGTKADPCRESCRFHQRNKVPEGEGYRGTGQYSSTGT